MAIVSAVLFDMDGVLIDANGVIERRGERRRSSAAA